MMRRRAVGTPRYRMTRATQWAVLDNGYMVRTDVDSRPGDLERGPDGRFATVVSIHPNMRDAIDSETRQGLLWDDKGHSKGVPQRKE